MSDDGNEIEKYTKSAQAISEAADKGADAIKKIADFTDTLFGNMVSNGFGLVGDKLAYYRLEQAIKLKEKVDKRLKDKGIDNTKYVPVNFGLPLLEKATVEENDELHTKWANLLSNAMDPNFNGNIQRGFVGILSEFEPLDARIAELIITEHNKTNGNESSLYDLKKLSKNIGLPIKTVDISVRNIVRLGVFKPGVVVSSGVSFGDHSLASYKDIELFGVTSLGVEFLKAVND